MLNKVFCRLILNFYIVHSVIDGEIDEFVKGEPVIRPDSVIAYMYLSRLQKMRVICLICLNTDT